jgi:hypothetical protein
LNSQHYRDSSKGYDTALLFEKKDGSARCGDTSSRNPFLTPVLAEDLDIFLDNFVFLTTITREHHFIKKLFVKIDSIDADFGKFSLLLRLRAWPPS